MDKNQNQFTMKEVVEITGLTEHSIRKYLKEFNIATQTTEGGHRRFTSETIDKLNVVIEKKELNWSIKEIRNFFNGEVTSDMLKKDKQLKTSIEKQVEEQNEKLDMLIDLNKELVNQLKNQEKSFQTKLDEQEKRHRLELEQQGEKIIDAVESRLNDAVEKRTLELGNSLSKVLEEKKEAQQKPGLLSRIFKR